MNKIFVTLLVLTLTSSCSTLQGASASRTAEMIPTFLNQIDENKLKDALTTLKDNASKGPYNYSVSYRKKEKRFGIHDYKYFIRNFVSIKKCSNDKDARQCFINSYKNKENSTYDSNYNSKKAIGEICKGYCGGASEISGVCMFLNSPEGKNWNPGQQFLKKACSDNDRKTSW